MIKFLIISLTIYFASVVSIYKYYHIIYSDRGICNDSKPDLADLVLNFLPIINTIYCLTWLIERPLQEKYRVFKRKNKKQKNKTFTLNKFYRLNNK